MPSGDVGGPHAPPPFQIAYEDEHLLVVDKAPGVVVHPAKGHREDTLSQLLAGSAAAATPSAPASSTASTATPPGCSSSRAPSRRTRCCRRRSRDARSSANTSPSCRVARRRARARSRRRSGATARVRTRMAVGGAHAREARTHFELDRALAEHSLLRLRLETGRTHQIRVHLRAIGHPVAGDPEYGTPGMLGLQRQFLHATRLAFAHPITGERIEVSSPLPADLQAALRRAERLS